MVDYQTIGVLYLIGVFVAAVVLNIGEDWEGTDTLGPICMGLLWPAGFLFLALFVLAWLPKKIGLYIRGLLK